MTTTQLQHKPAAAVKTMYLGLALTVVSALAVIIEGEDISQRLHQIEDRWLGPAKAAQSPSLVTTYLFIVAALGVVSWLVMARAVRMHKRWARPVAVLVALVAIGIAVLNLSMREYGQTILPTSVGLAGLLPCLAGVAAVVLLWKSPGHRSG